MAQQRSERVAHELHGTLNAIAGTLRDYEWIDSSPPGGPGYRLGDDLPRGPEYAIANVKALDDRIHHAMELSGLIEDGPLIRSIQSALAMLHELLAQPEIPAAAALHDGYADECVNIIKHALLEGYEQCGSALLRLAAQFIVTHNRDAAGQDATRATAKQSGNDDIKLDNVNKIAVMDGERIALTPDQASFIGVLMEAAGGWVSSTDERLALIGRPDRIRNNLPSKLKNRIHATRGLGFRME